jgi:peptide/nickel transport system substrate-binding protein
MLTNRNVARAFSTRPGRPPPRIVILGVIAVTIVLSSVARVEPQSPRYGGVLVSAPLSAPPSLSPHEEATIATLAVAAPCFNNLVTFDPTKQREAPDSVIGELAERWSWQDGGRALAFSLRKGVQWHDGKPFTARDVKYTFDGVRAAPNAAAKLRVNPRQEWYSNVEAIDTRDAFTVIFRLRRPQPSLLLMLATDYSPVYPAHVPVKGFRTRCVGTGPFRLKEYRTGEYVLLEKNPNYFIGGRPYLDGLKFVIIEDRSTQVAGLQAGQLDVSPAGWTRGNAEAAKTAVPQLTVIETSSNVNDNILVNFKRPPFTDIRVRRALNLALDRNSYIQGPRQGRAVPGGEMLPKPFGAWGLAPDDLARLPGTGDAAKQKEEAKKLLAEAGFGPAKPMRLNVSTRAVAIYVDGASWMIDQLKQVGIQATLEQVESAVWFGKMTRHDYDVALNLTGAGIDDPDANLYQNYRCGSPRNYSDYCSEEIDRLMDEQSQTLDPSRRLQLVQEIDRKLQLDGARPILGWQTRYIVLWPHVRGWVPQVSLHNGNRMQETWLDR